MAARKRARLSASDVNSLLDLSDSDSEVGIGDGIGDISSDSESEYAQDSEAISDCESNSGEEESESGLDERESGEKWVSYLPSHAEFPHFPFTVTNAGIQHSIPVPQTELEYFQKFFTDELFVEITNETNRYAGEKIRMNSPLQKYSIWKGWSDVSVLEMKALIGVVMNMAMNDKCSLQDYFLEQWVDKMPFFKDIFSRNRFMQIFWMLHLNPPTTNQGIATRGHKVKNVVDYIDNKCRANFIPGQNIAIDESTVAYKGRIIFKCYNPQKPTKWGLRIYALSDCETGYITVIIPYYGSVTTDQLIRPDLPFTSRIVVHLCSVLLTAAKGNGYHLYTDRFYTSYHLAVELLKENFHTTGTVMPNRKGLPTEIKKKNKSNVPKHQVAAFRHEDENVMVLSWKDKRLVTMLSTFHKVETTTIERVVKQGVIEKINKPTVIVDYTEHMGAVD